MVMVMAHGEEMSRRWSRMAPGEVRDRGLGVVWQCRERKKTF